MPRNHAERRFALEITAGSPLIGDVHYAVGETVMVDDPRASEIVAAGIARVLDEMTPEEIDAEQARHDHEDAKRDAEAVDPVAPKVDPAPVDPDPTNPAEPPKVV